MAWPVLQTHTRVERRARVALTEYEYNHDALLQRTGRRPCPTSRCEDDLDPVREDTLHPFRLIFRPQPFANGDHCCERNPTPTKSAPAQTKESRARSTAVRAGRRASGPPSTPGCSDIPFHRVNRENRKPRTRAHRCWACQAPGGVQGLPERVKRHSDR